MMEKEKQKEEDKKENIPDLDTWILKSDVYKIINDYIINADIYKFNRDTLLILRQVKKRVIDGEVRKYE